MYHTPKQARKTTSLAGLQKACGRGFSHHVQKACGRGSSHLMWEALKIETSRSPDIEVFKRFRDKDFPATPYTTAQIHTKDPHELGEFAITQATKLKVLIDSIREVEAYPRGDYQESLDLMEAYIGLNEGRIQYLGCGAVHKARWMRKQLYCYKMTML